MDENLNSFPFCEEINGVEHTYRITDNEGHFGVEKDGVIIAIVEQWETWEQTSGEPLDEALLQKIYDKIEDHYE